MNADSVKDRLKNYAEKNELSFQEVLGYYGLELLENEELLNEVLKEGVRVFKGTSLADQKKTKRKEAIAFANAINLIEGVPLPENVSNLFEQWADGGISHEELMGELVKSYRRPVS